METPTEHSERIQSVTDDGGVLLDELLGEIREIKIALRMLTVSINNLIKQRASVPADTEHLETADERKVIAVCSVCSKGIAGCKCLEPCWYGVRV